MAVLPGRRLYLLALGAAVPLTLATFEPLALPLALLYLLALGVVAAVDLRAAPGRTDFLVSRQHEPRLSIGEINTVTVRVEWTGRRRAAARHPRQLWIRDETPFDLPPGRWILSGWIVPGDAWTGHYEVRPERRGEYGFGETVLRIESPRGLWVRQLAFPTAAPARVYPNLRAVRRYEILARRGRLAEVGLRRSRLRGSGTEFERLREYQPDDDYRRIAWPATARRGQPVTIEYETERSQSLLLMIDSGRLMALRHGPLDKLDHAVNAALMLAYVALGRGDSVGLLTYADRVEHFLPPSRGRRQFQLLLEALFRIHAQPVEPNPERALTYLMARHAKRSLVVLFTDLVEAAEADRFVAHLAHLARRHLPLLVALSDPDLRHLAAVIPTDTRQAYERVVAQRLLDERRAVLERLERAGTLVLDVPADRLTADLLNRYLEIKARRAL